jgi:hypothetical protein
MAGAILNIMGPIRIVDRRADQHADDLAYWLARTPDERIAAVEFLRRQCLYATGQTQEPRLTKTLRLVPRRA